MGHAVSGVHTARRRSQGSNERLSLGLVSRRCMRLQGPTTFLCTHADPVQRGEGTYRVLIRVRHRAEALRIVDSVGREATEGHPARLTPQARATKNDGGELRIALSFQMLPVPEEAKAAGSNSVARPVPVALAALSSLPYMVTAFQLSDGVIVYQNPASVAYMGLLVHDRARCGSAGPCQPLLAQLEQRAGSHPLLQLLWRDAEAVQALVDCVAASSVRASVANTCGCRPRQGRLRTHLSARDIFSLHTARRSCTAWFACPPI